MFGRECRGNCLQYFKVNLGDLVNAQDRELWCPYCGFCGPAGDFLTQDQLAYVRSIGLRKLLEGPLGRTLKSLERKPDRRSFLSFGVTVTLPDIKIRNYVERQVERKLSCSQCGKAYAVYGISYWCPFCGPRNPGETFAENIAVIEHLLNMNAIVGSDSAVAEQLRQLGLDRKFDEKALDSAVTAFESFCKARVMSPLAVKDGITATEALSRIGTTFQNLQRGNDLLTKEFGFSYAQILSPSELKHLRAQFQKRHVLIHNSGIIDAPYCQKILQALSKVGQKVVVRKSDVREMVQVLGRLVAALDGQLP